MKTFFNLFIFLTYPLQYSNVPLGVHIRPLENLWFSVCFFLFFTWRNLLGVCAELQHTGLPPQWEQSGASRLLPRDVFCSCPDLFFNSLRPRGAAAWWFTLFLVQQPGGTSAERHFATKPCHSALAQGSWMASCLVCLHCVFLMCDFIMDPV